MQATSGVYSLSQKQGGYVHAFLLDDGTGLTMIDTLFDTEPKRIIDQVKQAGRSIRDIKHIILTHAHRSHLGGLARLKELSGAPVYVHEWEADIISGDRRPQPVSSLPHLPLRAYPLQLGLNLDLAKHRPITVDHYVHEGDRIGPVHVIFAPGHSPGHLAFYWPERRTLIAGDAICTWPNFSLGWSGFTLNPKQHRESLRRLCDFDAEVLCVGHGDPIVSGAAKRIRDSVYHQ